MDDKHRVALALRHADELDNMADSVNDPPEPESLRNIAHSLRKFATFVLDRDAGPSNDLRAENTKLEGINDQLREEITRLTQQLRGVKNG
jgi:hypothetical protein